MRCFDKYCYTRFEECTKALSAAVFFLYKSFTVVKQISCLDTLPFLRPYSASSRFVPSNNIIFLNRFLATSTQSCFYFTFKNLRMNFIATRILPNRSFNCLEIIVFGRMSSLSNYQTVRQRTVTFNG